MKKIFLSSLFIIIFSIFGPNIAHAQYSQALIPGYNCGVAGNIAKSKCCTPTEMGNNVLPDLGPGFNTIRDIILGPGMSFIKQQIEPWQKYQKDLSVPCLEGVQSTADPADPSCRCTYNGVAPTPAPLAKLKEFCARHQGSEVAACESCVDDGGLWSGIGCIQTDLRKFIQETLLGMGVGLAGGISLLCIIYAAFMIQTSQGVPDRLKKAQELLTSCLMGLVFIIFSVFILRLIGVDILRIPGFK